ncbi:Hypothetical protein NGAL_HAMBI2605_65590 [Neorhizobium galegae bv. orientalis]|nr:Hypothetical protein NGAL_HAMBI2605_65590 [Neorhizobium galegae bv. orientalis]
MRPRPILGRLRLRPVNAGVEVRNGKIVQRLAALATIASQEVDGPRFGRFSGLSTTEHGALQRLAQQQLALRFDTLVVRGQRADLP